MKVQIAVHCDPQSRMRAEALDPPCQTPDEGFSE